MATNDEEYHSVHDGPIMDKAISMIVDGEVDDAARRAEAAAMSAVQSAGHASNSEAAIKEAIDHIPPGSVPVINDLTTGGAAVALSAEQGKKLNQEKASLEWTTAQMSKKVSMYSISGVDLNTVTTAGHYRLNGGCTNVPITGEGWEQWSQMLVVHGGGDNTSQVMFIYWTGEVRTRSIKSGTMWTDWISLATCTPPEEHALPLVAGCTGEIRYSKDQFGKLLIPGIYVTATRQIIAGEAITTLPVGYRLASAAGARVFASLGNALSNLYIDPNGSIMVSVAVAQGEVICAGIISFIATSTDAIAQQSTPVRMSVPVARMARSALPKEPEKRLMCVVGAAGEYVEFVEVTVTYNEEWETLGALFTPYCYALKDGERLVDSPTPPTKRTHAGVDGLVKPVWDDDGKMWLESATAEETAAWELEHPDPGKTPEAVRAKRDTLLSATDKYAVLDAPISAETRSELYDYRQALRDVPEQESFPESVVWPELPAITKAAPDPVDTAFDVMTGGNGNA